MKTTEPNSGDSRKRILVSDPTPLCREALRSLILSEPGLTLIAACSTAIETLSVLETRSADLVIVELSDTDGCGLGLIQDLRVHHPRIRILVLSSHPETCIAERALQAGAHGFVQKSRSLETILRSIHTVAEGGTYVSEELSARLALKYLGVGSSGAASPLEGLSNRELQVFRLIGSGQPTRAIAASLGISIKTVETYIDHLKRKLGVESGVALTHRAVQWMERGILQ
jgi:DNA-binding NarL/FixJ family response regulator